jgi:hypothetical protein
VNHTYCLVSLLTFLIPANFGTVLNLLISSVRLYLAGKAAKNEKPPRYQNIIINFLSFKDKLDCLTNAIGFFRE